MLIRKRRYNGNAPGSSGNNGEQGQQGQQNNNGGGTAGNQGGNNNQGQQQTQTPAAPAGITPEIQAFIDAESQRKANAAAETVRTQEKAKYDKAQTDAAATAEAAAAAKRGEFETLYNAEKAAHAQTTVKAGRLDALSTAVHAGIETEIANWPDEVKALDPGKDADAEARLKWAGNARALAAKLSGGTQQQNRQAPQGQHGTGNKQQQGNGGNQGGGNGGQQPAGTTQEAVTNYGNRTYPRPNFSQKS